MSNLESYKKKLNSALKLNGIIIRSEFSSLIVESLYNANISLDTNFGHYIKIICETLEKYIECERSIEREQIERAIEACIHTGIDDVENKLTITDAFHFPKLEFDMYMKQYKINKKIKPEIVANPDHKNQLFIDRYEMILEKTKRCFKQKNEQLDDNKISFHTVDFLLCCSQKVLQNKMILGSLFQSANGKYFLEDPTGMVELDLTHTKYHIGFFYENCIVLVNGIYTDKVLQVSTMLQPPGEKYVDAKSLFSNINYFGGKSMSSLRESIKLSGIMHENENDIIVFISDLWMDKNIVLEKLEVLFQGLSDMPPIAFVFLGNFLSQCYGNESFEILKKSFKKLAELINKFDNIMKASHFVFVPGLNDPCMTHILPRIPLPTILSQDFKKLVPNSTFTTNPCRIQYCTREIVVIRSDMLTKFMQESLNRPSKEKTQDFITKSIISQGHLSPFSLNSQPVHWSFDYCLYLHPLPNLVVVGDKCNSYCGREKECTVINPIFITFTTYFFLTKKFSS